MGEPIPTERHAMCRCCLVTMQCLPVCVWVTIDFAFRSAYTDGCLGKQSKCHSECAGNTQEYPSLNMFVVRHYLCYTHKQLPWEWNCVLKGT